MEVAESKTEKLEASQATPVEMSGIWGLDGLTSGFRRFWSLGEGRDLGHFESFGFDCLGVAMLV